MQRLRLQYLARHQEVGVRRDAAELHSIKHELNALLSSSMSTPPTNAHWRGPVSSENTAPSVANGNNLSNGGGFYSSGLSGHGAAATVGPACAPSAATAMCPHPVNPLDAIAATMPRAHGTTGTRAAGVASASELLEQLMNEVDASAAAAEAAAGRSGRAGVMYNSNAATVGDGV